MFINIIRKTKSQNSGYTLVETLAVVAVMSIMSIVFVSNYLSTRKRVAVEQAAQELVMNLRFAQNMAMNVSQFNGQIPEGGYGLYFNPVGYEIFADLDNSKVYEFGEGVSTHRLGPNITLTDVNGPHVIDFVPPDPKIFINGITTSNPLVLILRYDFGSPTKTITINTITGQITVN